MSEGNEDTLKLDPPATRALVEKAAAGICNMLKKESRRPLGPRVYRLLKKSLAILVAEIDSFELVSALESSTEAQEHLHELAKSLDDSFSRRWIENWLRILKTKKNTGSFASELERSGFESKSERDSKAFVDSFHCTHPYLRLQMFEELCKHLAS